MDEEKYKFFRRIMLMKLYNARKWGKSHTHYKHMINALPRHERGSKEGRDAYKDLVKEGLVLTKPTNQGVHVSLNPYLSKEIKAELGLL